MTYILSCSYAEWLKGKDVVPAVAAGYSMGIYAAACLAGSISFEDGLFIIRNAYNEIQRFIAGKRYAMGSVVGLEKEYIDQRIMADTYP